MVTTFALKLRYIVTDRRTSPPIVPGWLSPMKRPRAHSQQQSTSRSILSRGTSCRRRRRARCRPRRSAGCGRRRGERSSAADLDL